MPCFIYALKSAISCVGGYIEKERYRTMLYLARAEPEAVAREI